MTVDEISLSLKDTIARGHDGLDLRSAHQTLSPGHEFPSRGLEDLLLASP